MAAKAAKMDDSRNPRRLLQAWTPQPRTKGRPYKTIGRSYENTVKDTLKLDPEFSNWLPIARDHSRQWRDWVEWKLELKRGDIPSPQETKKQLIKVTDRTQTVNL